MAACTRTARCPALPLLRECSAGSAPLPRHTTVCAKDLPPSHSRVPPLHIDISCPLCPSILRQLSDQAGQVQQVGCWFCPPQFPLGFDAIGSAIKLKIELLRTTYKMSGHPDVALFNNDVACFAWPGTSWPRWPHSRQELIMAQGRGKLRLLLRTVVGAIVQSRLRCPKWGRGFGPALCSGMMPMPKLAKFNLVCGCRHGPRFSFTSSFLSLVGTPRNQGPGEQQVCVTTLDRPPPASPLHTAHSPPPPLLLGAARAARVCHDGQQVRQMRWSALALALLEPLHSHRKRT